MKILDHGSVELIETWGSDERVIEAARMSTAKGFQGWGPVHAENCNSRHTDDVEEYLCNCQPKPGDEKLLRYLWEHGHHTPFEMAGATFEIQAPIFVFREWHRHRTQCLAPDTLIYFSNPGKRGIYRQKISELWRKWRPTVRTDRPERQVNALWPRSRIQGMLLRCADEERGEIATTSITDVILGPPKRMVTIMTAGGKQLTATPEHRVLTRSGWATLGDAIKHGLLLAGEGFARDFSSRGERPVIDETRETWRTIADNDWYVVSDQGRVRAARPIRTQRSDIQAGELIRTYGANGGRGYECASLRAEGGTTARLVHSLVLEAFVGPRPEGHEARHLNSNVADARLANLAWGTAKENADDRVIADRQQRLHVRYEEIVSVEDAGELPTFDLSVAGPWHNFVANGLIVHNSYNELSARYTPLPDVNYLPTVARMVGGVAEAGANRQAQGLRPVSPVDGHEATDAELEASFTDWLSQLDDLYAHAQRVYEQGLLRGVPKEIARLPVTVGRYSRMRASANLRNWLHFLELRQHASAQWEIRQYANAVHDFLAERFPRTLALFDEGR